MDGNEQFLTIFKHAGTLLCHAYSGSKKKVKVMVIQIIFPQFIQNSQTWQSVNLGQYFDLKLSKGEMVLLVTDRPPSPTHICRLFGYFQTLDIHNSLFAIFFKNLLILAGFCSCYGFSFGHYWQQWDVQCAMSIFYREMMFSGKDGRGDKRWKCEHRCLVYNIYLVIGWSWFTWFSWFRESTKFTTFVWLNSIGSHVILV